MFLHYLKIAWRNLLKYKTQSVVSIVGLAIGFTAFAFTMSWIRYERGYDSHIQDVDRVYRVFIKDSTLVGGINKSTPSPLASYLKENFPEIEASTRVLSYKSDWNVNGKEFISQCHFIYTDSSFFRVFYPEMKIIYPEVIDKPYNILSTTTANKLGLGMQDIGHRIESFNINLLGIVPDKSTYSNVPFDVIYIQQFRAEYDMDWTSWARPTYIRVKEGIDMVVLEDKLTKISIKHSYPGGSHTQRYECKLVPLKKLRTLHPDTEVAIQYHHLRLFVVVALLVIFCAFFNYLMLFINRIKNRNKALALQKVNGASNPQLLTMLFSEFTLLLLAALLVGLVLMELFYPSFARFSMIEAQKSFFLQDAILFAISIFLLSLVFAFFPVRYFMKRSIQQNLLPEIQRSGRLKDRFTQITIGLQLVISILLIFSTSIFVYQFNYLNGKDIGFNRYNINTIRTYPNEIPIDEIKKIPGVEEVIRYGGDFLPQSKTMRFSVDTPEDCYMFFQFDLFGPEFVDFFDIHIIEGRNIFEGEKGVYLINQTADRLLSKRDSTGVKRVNGLPVVGVVEDMYIDSPLIPVFPTVYTLSEPQSRGTMFYAYKYQKEARRNIEKEIEKIGREEAENDDVIFFNMEELYAEYTKSERYLLILLSIMTGVSILIALFGIYAMITLACNKRRKEIAIRKVNGAKAKEIFTMFFRQYFWITLLASVIAFLVGALVMQRWLEQYTRRIEMEWWLFVGIFLLITLIVYASIIFRVNRAVRENPAGVVKAD